MPISANVTRSIGSDCEPRPFAAEKWLEDNDLEGVAFEYEVLE
jgi:hypothetical protein